MSLRMTRQREVVASLLESVEGFHSAQELYEMLLSDGERIGLATVYRTLQLFSEHELVDVMRNADGESVYRSCQAAGRHHHHLLCRKCSKTIEIDGPTVEQWALQVGARHGFTDIEHTIELYGICSNCRATAGANTG